MSVGDVVGWLVLIGLALYGCAQCIRRLCLWMFRCESCALSCRVAVPHDGAALAPLGRCLQSQTVWDDGQYCPYTLLLLPEETEESPEEISAIFRECPSVIPVSAEELADVIRRLAEK